MTSRRDFLKTIITAAGMVSLHNLFSAQDVLAALKPRRLLNLYNPHTGEQLILRYSSRGIWNEDDQEKLNYFLRCHYTNEIKPIPPTLINALCRVKDRFGPSRQIKLISGYRSREYNEYLRMTGHQVAKESLHLQGLAVDFAIPGIRNRDVSRYARRLKQGGVGRYPDFVHIDIGRVRYW
jgi:uncharacterized protein YcbK (DUF882 family)